MTEEVQSLHEETQYLERRLAKVEHENRDLCQRLDVTRREQHGQTQPFRHKKRIPACPKCISRV